MIARQGASRSRPGPCNNAFAKLTQILRIGLPTPPRTHPRLRSSPEIDQSHTEPEVPIPFQTVWKCSKSGEPGRRGEVAIRPAQSGTDRRRLYLPDAWGADKARRRQVRVPEPVTFATRPQIATDLIAAALDARAPCAWVLADALYGSDSRRRWMVEARRQPCARSRVISAPGTGPSGWRVFQSA